MIPLKRTLFLEEMWRLTRPSLLMNLRIYHHFLWMRGVIFIDPYTWIPLKIIVNLWPWIMMRILIILKMEIKSMLKNFMKLEKIHKVKNLLKPMVDPMMVMPINLNGIKCLCICEAEREQASMEGNTGSQWSVPNALLGDHEEWKSSNLQASLRVFQIGKMV